MTIDKKLYVGFGILYLILVLQAVLSYGRILQIKSNIRILVEIKEPLQEVVQEMESSFKESTNGVLSYMRSRDPKARERVSNAAVAFHAYEEKFQQLAESMKTRDLTEDVRGLYSGFRQSAEEIMNVVDRQDAAIQEFRSAMKSLDQVLVERVQEADDRLTKSEAGRLEKAARLGGQLESFRTAVESYVAAPDPEVRSAAQDSAVRFEELQSALLTENALSPEERAAFSQVTREFQRLRERGEESMDLEDRERDALARLERDQAAIEQIFDFKIQPKLKKEMEAAGEEANQAVLMAGIGTLVLGLGGFAVAVCAAYFLGRTIVLPITQAVHRLSSASAEIRTAAAQQTTGAGQQAGAVAQTATTVSQVQQTSEQAAQRAKAVADKSRESEQVAASGRQAVNDSIIGMNLVRERVETVAENILGVAEKTQAIGEIISAVSDIAEQTNLLALNAAIEASRAGEQGRGFAVVAGEIKALASQSKKATAQVRQILGDIQKGTHEAVMSTEESTKSVHATVQTLDRAGETIRALAETVAEASQAAAQTSASAAQQAIGMSQIQQAMKNIDQVVKQSLAATRQSEQAAHDLNQVASELRQQITG
ncbi:MAG: MCP four helix bundle domain-containing protein [Planctomycetes bacterium]|nr:MCP four helix bundle domain-containing protein [Planctomycetota bacterium]